MYAFAYGFRKEDYITIWMRIHFLEGSLTMMR